MTTHRNSVWAATRLWAFLGLLTWGALSDSAVALTVEHAWSMGDGKRLRILFNEAVEPGASCRPGNYTMGPETKIELVRMIGSQCVEITVDQLPTAYQPRIGLQCLTDNTPERKPLKGGEGVPVVTEDKGLCYRMVLTPEGMLLNDRAPGGHARLGEGARVEANAGPFGGPALALDGVAGQATTSENANLGNGDFTIMLWLKSERNSESTILSKNGGKNGQSGWRVSVDAQKRSVALTLGDETCETAPGALPMGTWIHLAFLCRGGYTFAFVNGRRSGIRGEMTGRGGLSNDFALRIGRGADNSKGCWQGKMASVTVLPQAVGIGRIRAEARAAGGAPAPDGPYRCLLNHSLVIPAGSSSMPKQYTALIRSLKHTDVDAVMCGPQMWRCPLFPSEAEPMWKAYKPGQPVSAFKPWDLAMTYLHGGGDPVRDTLEACRETGKAFFVSYRMNDTQYTDNPDWPCHPDFWKNHPEFWLGTGKGERSHNYMLPQVRDYYFAILEELCTNYDVDGLELDLLRAPRYFRDGEITKGTPVMTGFVKRIRTMLDRLGKERGKSLKLCVRVPHTITECEKAGLDVVGWDAAGLVDMINVSMSTALSLDIGIEEFQARTKRARIYGEMNYVTKKRAKPGSGKPYSTPEAYRNAALNFLNRGADGLSFYNFFYASRELRPAVCNALEGITDIDYLKTCLKQQKATSKASNEIPQGTSISASSSQTTPPRHPPVDYKCIFNHELLIISHKKDNTAKYIKDFIRKFKGTDVDAIMCCPEMWRTNTFPSEVDPTWKKYKPGQPKSKFGSWDRMMTYLHKGGDPVKDTLEACREIGMDFFISYRMNDHHYIDDLEWPCHNDFWRNHPEYWLADTNTSGFARDRDDKRLHNYMLPEVRDYYYAIIEELCTNYDVDGVEFDFQRYPQFFRNDDVPEGTKVMTAFVVAIRNMLDRIGAERGKHLRLCARIPHTVAHCEKAGLDVIGWDAAGLLDMINVSSSYFHTTEMDIEGFQARTGNARIYAEMNYVTYQNSKVSKYARRYTTIPIYRATALNFFTRGADGLSIFNWDYVPGKKRLDMVPGLRGITDLGFLKTAEKNYAVYPFFGSFKKPNEETIELVIPDDTSKGLFKRSVLRVETRTPCEDLGIAVWLNGRRLEEGEHQGAELFAPIAQNAGYPERNVLKFYTVPLDAIIPDKNTIKIENLDRKKRSCKFFSMELALYR